ncbi:hypothetical protein [Arthrobacter sp. HLT1-20]
MPQWLIFAVIALVWAAAVLVIVVFMIGASRARHKQRQLEKAAAEKRLAPTDS